MLVRFLLAAMLTFAASALAADINDVKSFDIKAQPLDRALIEFSKQAGFQVVSNGADISRLQAPAVSGSKTVARALEELLAGSGLTFRVIGADVITVERGRKPAAGVQHSEAVVVTGTHIRGLENQTAPLVTLDRAYIESTGYATTSQLIESLPQNFALANQAVTLSNFGESRLQGASINLRGLGEGTTLVLLNGRRIALSFLGGAVDISALPLSAVERVEVLTDGASAIYGSDAVGGVVNFVLRRDFSGNETRARAGRAEGGIDEVRLAHAFGHAWGSGNVVLSAEYYKRDMLLSSARDWVPAESQIGSMFPRDETGSFMFSGRQALTGTLEGFADVLYAKRRSYNEAGQTTFAEKYSSSNPQHNATAGLTWRFGRDWQLEAAATHARNELEQSYLTTRVGAGGGGGVTRDFDVRAAGLKADGALFALPAGTVRAAIGVDWRSESLTAVPYILTGGFAGTPIDVEQNVRSAFGEVYATLVGPGSRMDWVHRLDLSVAGRYDDYSRFGSHFDPKVGVMWSPVADLRLRASYGTSYVAPRLSDYNIVGTNQALSLFSPDPGLNNAPSHQLIILGNSGDLAPQKSKNFTLGLTFVPSSVPGLRLEGNYYDIEYRDRISSTPMNTVILGNPAAYGSLFIRNPTVAQVNEYVAIGRLGVLGLRVIPPTRIFDPATVAAIVDMRRRNLSVIETSGFDIAVQYDMKLAGGDFQAGLTATHIKGLVQQVTSTSAPFETVDTIANPVETRVRGALGYSRGGWMGNLFVNYVGAYFDNRRTPSTPIQSHTTVDARVAYDFGKRARTGWLSGLTLALSVQNLFDRDPPSTAVLLPDRDMGFDPTNANPLGRVVALELVKTW